MYDNETFVSSNLNIFIVSLFSIL